MHRAHGQEVLEHVAVLAVVGDLHKAVRAATQRVLDDRHRRGLRARALEEAAVSALRLLLGETRHAAELAVHVEHGVAGNRHVREHDARREGLGKGCEAVDETRKVLGHLVLVPDETAGRVVELGRLVHVLLHKRRAVLGLDETRQALVRELRCHLAHLALDGRRVHGPRLRTRHAKVLLAHGAPAHLLGRAAHRRQLARLHPKVR
mmetsp:Transcript_17760/g.51679  ORF Transcript_17760/g.51679 Transcript_17760/m.51679 type:complete len:206 (-) Transcript_17760:801-1418(-)